MMCSKCSCKRHETRGYTELSDGKVGAPYFKQRLAFAIQQLTVAVKSVLDLYWYY